MRRQTTKLALAAAALTGVVLSATSATAGKMDLSLANFIECDTPATCVPHIAAYEQFLAEYAFGLAPKILAPAETLGYSGFYMGLEGTLTPLSGIYNSDRWHAGTVAAGDADQVMFMPAVHVRKGLPWSFELGGSINYLSHSELVGLGGEVKWSLFEGYRHGFRGVLPDIAARGSVVRVIGESDVDMTIVGVDGSISYNFGVGGQIVLVPYVGYQYLWTFVRIEPLIYRDEDNNFHSPQGDDWDTTGLSGPNLQRMKLFLGLKFQYELLTITAEGGWGLKSEWDTAIEEPDRDNPFHEGWEREKSASVGHQGQASLGVGMEF